MREFLLSFPVTYCIIKRCVVLFNISFYTLRSVPRTAKDKACLTNLMNNLEKKGYVHRKEDPEDRRNKLVFLTPEGEEFKKQIRPILDQVYVHAEHIIGIENVETMLSELKAVHNVLENI